MTLWDDYMRRIEEDITRLRSDLEPLENGIMHIRSCPAGGEWVDMTQSWIEHLKRTIAIYEAILAHYRKEK